MGISLHPLRSSFRLAPLLLTAAVVSAAGFSSIFQQEPPLPLFPQILFFSVLVTATAVAVRDAHDHTLGCRLFWIFIAFAYGLWALNQGMCAYFVLRFRTVPPAQSIADPALFLHTIPLITAVSLLPHLSRITHLYRGILNFALLLFFWSAVYAYFVFPHQHLFWNPATYDRRFDSLYVIANLTLLAFLAVLINYVQGAWKFVYAHLLGASLLYVFGYFIMHLAAGAGTHLNTTFYTLSLAASLCWFIWLPLRARGLTCAQPEGPARDESGSPSVFSIFAVLALLLVACWEFLRIDEPPTVQKFRLFAAVVFGILLAIVAIFELYFANRDTALLLRRNCLQRTLSEAAVHAGERLQRAIVDSLDNGLAVLDRGGNIIDVNDAWMRLSHANAVLNGHIGPGHNFLQVCRHEATICPELSALTEGIDSVLGGRVAVFRRQHRCIHSRPQRWFLTTVTPIDIPGGGVVISQKDITDVQSTEIQLRDSEDRYRDLVEHSRDLLYTHDLSGRLLSVNRAVAQNVGYTVEELLQRSIPGLLPDNAHDLFRAYINDILDNGVVSGLMQIVTRTGEKRTWEYHNSLRTEGVAAPIVRGMARDITEQKRVEEALKASERKLSLHLQQTMLGVIATDPQLKVTEWNPAAEAIFGYTREEALGRSLIELIVPPEMTGKINTITEKLLAGTGGAYSSNQNVTRDRKTITCEWFNTPVRAADGCITGVISLVQDITARKRAEEALRKSEEKFYKAFHASPVVVTLATATEDRLLEVNDTFETLTGYSRQEVIGRTSIDIGLLEDPLELQRLTSELFQGGGSLRNAESRFRMKDGSVRIGLISAEPISINDRDCTLSVISDITGRKAVEEKLREREEQLRSIVSSAMDAIIAINEQQQIVLFNAAAEKMFLCSAQDAIGTSLDRFISQPFRGKHQENIRQFSESAEVSRTMSGDGALWALRTNGEEFPVEASISHAKSGNRHFFTVIVRDVTERRKVELGLQESEERFRLVANTAPVMIWMAGNHRNCTFFNKTWLDFTGRRIESELGYGWIHNVHPEDLKASQDQYSKAFERREPFEMQYRLRRRDGQYRWMLDIGVPRFSQDGCLTGYIGSCIDITERKHAEEALATIGRRLIQAQERERSRIARDLHDDINQRLAFASIKLAKIKTDLLETPGSAQTDIDALCEYLSDLSSDIQNLSHELHSPRLQYLGVVPALKNFCREFELEQEVEIEFTDHAVPTEIPPEASLCLYRILQEALHNAVKYSGVQRFEVELKASDTEIILCVRDSGRGFDPHAALTGHGLGLISMRERLHLVHGKLAIESKPGCGSAITAHIPIPFARQTKSKRAG